MESDPAGSETVDPEMDTIRAYVRTVLGTPGSHGYDHIERVTAMCERIGREEHADLRILIPAALLHDIARPLEKEHGIPHDVEGARMAEEFLRSIHYEDRCIPPITHAIRTHRFRSVEKPATLEAQILSDADKIDAMGAIGIARTFIRAGEHGGTALDGIDHIREKLLKLSVRMYTKTGKRIAAERSEFLVRFRDLLIEEMEITPS